MNFSSSKKYRYNNDTSALESPSNKSTSAKKKKKKTFKGNYGDQQNLEAKGTIFRSGMDRNFNKVVSIEPSYVNVKNTIASSSSKMTSNNTS